MCLCMQPTYWEVQGSCNAAQLKEPTRETIISNTRDYSRMIRTDRAGIIR